jgi:hypothetical protein
VKIYYLMPGKTVLHSSEGSFFAEEFFTQNNNGEKIGDRKVVGENTNNGGVKLLVKTPTMAGTMAGQTS